jgi:hypothetical protein
MSKIVKDYAEGNLIFLATCPEIFGGYGLTATGRSRAEAIDALWTKYTEVSKQWNSGEQNCKGYNELRNEWGVSIRVCKLGEGYFGDDGYNEESSHDKITVNYIGNREVDEDLDVQAVASGMGTIVGHLDLIEQRSEDERCNVTEDNLRRFIELIDELGVEELKSLASKANKSAEDKIKLVISPSTSALLNDID